MIKKHAKLPRRSNNIIFFCLSVTFSLDCNSFGLHQKCLPRHMGDPSKFPKSCSFEIPIIKLAPWPLNIHNFKLKWSIVLSHTENKSEMQL